MSHISMKRPLVTSAIFHGLVIFVVSFGFPLFVKTPPLVVNAPVMLEIVALDKITQTNKIKTPPPKPEKQEKPMPPQMLEEAPPDMTVDAEAVPLPSAPKEKEPPPVVKPKPEVTKVKKEPAEKDFASLLKNLIPDKIEDTQENIEEDKTPEKEEIAPLAERLTISEIDALRYQLGQCWLVMSGARYAENLIIEVRVHINPDRTVREATILDKARYNRDSYFKAAADAALRALRNPNCSPLKLPENKYESWKSTIIRFDPSQML